MWQKFVESLHDQWEIVESSPEILYLENPKTSKPNVHPPSLSVKSSILTVIERQSDTKKFILESIQFHVDNWLEIMMNTKTFAGSDGFVKI